MTVKSAVLSAAHREALIDYAAWAGSRWPQRLRSDWQAGRSLWADRRWPMLRRLRATLGERVFDAAGV